MTSRNYGDNYGDMKMPGTSHIDVRPFLSLYEYQISKRPTHGANCVLKCIGQLRSPHPSPRDSVPALALAPFPHLSCIPPVRVAGSLFTTNKSVVRYPILQIRSSPSLRQCAITLMSSSVPCRGDDGKCRKRSRLELEGQRGGGVLLGARRGRHGERPHRTLLP